MILPSSLFPCLMRPPRTTSSGRGRRRAVVEDDTKRVRPATPGPEKDKRRGGSAKTGKRRRWDFDRPLASASRAARQSEPSPRKKGSVLVRPRSACFTLCAAHTLDGELPGTIASLSARPVFHLNHHGTNSKSIQERIYKQKRREFRPLNTSDIAYIQIDCA